MVTIMALTCHAVIAAYGKILSTQGDINVSKPLGNRPGCRHVCAIEKIELILFIDIF